MKALQLVLTVLILIIIESQQLQMMNNIYRIVSAPIKKLSQYIPQESCEEKLGNVTNCCITLKLRSHHVSHCVLIKEDERLAEQYLEYNGKVLLREVLKNGEICLYIRLIDSTICTQVTGLTVHYTPPVYFTACFGFSFKFHTLEYYEELKPFCHGLSNSPAARHR